MKVFSFGDIEYEYFRTFFVLFVLFCLVGYLIMLFE